MGMVKQRMGGDYLVGPIAPDDVLIPEEMGEEPRAMMQSMRDFAAKEIDPVADLLEQRDEATHRRLFKKAAELGIFMAEVPEEYGGLGLSVLGIAGMMESRSYFGSFSSTAFAHQGIGCLPLINFGTPAQIDKYLERLMNGELMACFALTEPSSGSDAMNIKTTAVLSEDETHFIVNGSKQFITNAGFADIFILFAKVDGQQFTAFLLERDSEGFEVGRNEDLLGQRGSSVCPLMLVDVKIPVENVLGEVGKGHKVALCTLNLGRLKMATNCTGGGKKALRIAAQYAAERTQFGGPIARFGMIKQKLADMAARLYATQSMAYRTAGLVYDALESLGVEGKSIDKRLDVLTEFQMECAQSKYFGAEMINYLADETLQIHGGYGFSEEYPAAKLYRDWRITRIYEGTSEICRNTVTKGILKKGRSGELDLRAAFAGAVPQLRPDSSDDRGDSLDDLIAQIADYKHVFAYSLRAAIDAFGEEGVLANDNQQAVSCIADIATEIFAAESAVLRVAKLKTKAPDTDTSIPEALARLYFHRAGERIRHEATELLGDIYSGDTLREKLDALSAWLPLPINRLALRNFVANALVASGGELPDYRLDL